MQTLTRLGVASALACCITTAVVAGNANATPSHPKPVAPRSIAATAFSPVAGRPAPLRPASGNAQADYMRAYNAYQAQAAGVESTGATAGIAIGAPAGCLLGALFGVPTALAGAVVPPALLFTVPFGVVFTGMACVVGGGIGATFGILASQAANPWLSTEASQLQARCYQVMPEPVCLNEWVLPYLDTSSPVAGHLSTARAVRQVRHGR